MKSWNDLPPRRRRLRTAFAWGILLPAIAALSLGWALLATQQAAGIRALLGL